MLTIVIFTMLQLSASSYACWRGGAPERWVASLLLLACIGSLLAPLQPAFSYRVLNLPVLRVDLLLFAALVAVALVADRYWPMWIAACQLVAIGAHGVRVYSPEVLPVAYWWLTSKIAYPMLVLLVAGAARHRARLLAGLPEYGWTSQRLRDGADAAGRRPT